MMPRPFKNRKTCPQPVFQKHLTTLCPALASGTGKSTRQTGAPQGAYILGRDANNI